jgi:hypothetical protein
MAEPSSHKVWEGTSITSGYSRVEELKILNEFKRRLNLGLSLESSIASMNGLDTWIIKRHGASGVKRYIESQMVKVANELGKKSLSKLTSGQRDLLIKAKKQSTKDTGTVEDHIISQMAPNIRARNSRKDELGWSESKHKSGIIYEQLPCDSAIYTDDSDSFSDYRRKVINSSSITRGKLGGRVSLSDLGLDRISNHLPKRMETAGVKALEALEELDLFKEGEDRLDRMIAMAVKANESAREALEYRNDRVRIRESVESLIEERNSLVREELESLKDYEEDMSAIISEYERMEFFDNSPSLIDRLFENEKMKEKTEGRKEMEAKSLDGDSDLLFSAVEENCKKHISKTDSAKIKRNEEILLQKNVDFDIPVSHKGRFITWYDYKTITSKYFAGKEHKRRPKELMEIILFAGSRIFNTYHPKPKLDRKESRRLKNKAVGIISEIIGDKSISRQDGEFSLNLIKDSIAPFYRRRRYNITAPKNSYRVVEDELESKRVEMHRMAEYNRKLDRYKSVDCSREEDEAKLEVLSKRKVSFERRMGILGSSQRIKRRISWLDQEMGSIRERLNVQMPEIPLIEPVMTTVETDEQLQYNAFLKMDREEMIESGLYEPTLRPNPDEFIQSLRMKLLDPSRFPREKIEFKMGNDYEITASKSSEGLSCLIGPLNTSQVFDDLRAILISNIPSSVHDSVMQDDIWLQCVVSSVCYGYISKRILPARKSRRVLICREVETALGMF